MLRGLQGWHLIIIVLAFVVLFGFKRLPDAARSIGRSMRIFKSEVDEMKAEHAAGKSEAARETVEGQRVDEAGDDAQGPAVPPVGQGSPEQRPDRTA